MSAPQTYISDLEQYRTDINAWIDAEIAAASDPTASGPTSPPPPPPKV